MTTTERAMVRVALQSVAPNTLTWLNVFSMTDDEIRNALAVHGLTWTDVLRVNT